MKRAERRNQIANKRTIHYQTTGNPCETKYTDQFGTHFEVRYESPKGAIYSRRITRCEVWGWTVTWDEARASVMDAALKDSQR